MLNTIKMNSKALFLSQQNFIDSLFQMQPEGPLTDHFGIRFRGLDEITHNENDDGEFAGPQFYEMYQSGPNVGNFPKKFPCIVVCYEYDDNRYVSSYIYPEDFSLIG